MAKMVSEFSSSKPEDNSDPSSKIASSFHGVRPILDRCRLSSYRERRVTGVTW